MPTLPQAGAIALATTLVIITVQHFLLSSKQPADTRMDMMMNRGKNNYLRSHQRNALDRFMPTHDLLQGADEFFSSNAVAKTDRDDFFPASDLFNWHDEFFSPLLESPFMREFHRQQHMMMMEPTFNMNEDGDKGMCVLYVWYPQKYPSLHPNGTNINLH